MSVPQPKVSCNRCYAENVHLYDFETVNGSIKVCRTCYQMLHSDLEEEVEQHVGKSPVVTLAEITVVKNRMMAAWEGSCDLTVTGTTESYKVYSAATTHHARVCRRSRRPTLPRREKDNDLSLCGSPSRTIPQRDP